MQWREIPAVWCLFVVELLTAQAKEINLFHHRMGLTQCIAATIYCFSSHPCEQDTTSSNTVHLIETVVNETVKKIEELYS